MSVNWSSNPDERRAAHRREADNQEHQIRNGIRCLQEAQDLLRIPDLDSDTARMDMLAASEHISNLIASERNRLHLHIGTKNIKP